MRLQARKTARVSSGRCGSTFEGDSAASRCTSGSSLGMMLAGFGASEITGFGAVLCSLPVSSCWKYTSCPYVPFEDPQHIMHCQQFPFLELTILVVEAEGLGLDVGRISSLLRLIGCVVWLASGACGCSFWAAGCGVKPLDCSGRGLSTNDGGLKARLSEFLCISLSK